MKPKLALVVSVALTSFVVVILTGVITQVKEAAAPVEETIQVDPTAGFTFTPTETLVPTAQKTPLSPEQAANMAAQILSRQDLFSVEKVTNSGLVTYKVAFSNGDIVYMGQDGQVLSIEIQTHPTNVAANIIDGNNNASSAGLNRNHQESNNSGNDEGGEHEDEGD
jgi:hypothetical protein